MSDGLRRGTVCFLQKENKLLLALIEYGPTTQYWTGIGGFANDGESIEDAVIREAEEETYIQIDKKYLKKVAEINGDFQLSVFLTSQWSGEIKTKESSLKKMQWFSIHELPFSQMHPGTQSWLLKVLEGRLIRLSGDQIEEVNKFK
jgi:ADP-ribose pyrophosphatase YjhB (NUDIX family)